MPRRAQFALLGAAAGIALLVLTWLLAFHVGFVERADQSLFRDFGGLTQHPHVAGVARWLAGLCNPNPYVYLAAAPILVALMRRRGWLAVAICAILLGANESTQLLKPLLAHPRAASLLGGQTPVAPASWPSGHATAAMSLALCCILAAPARRRPAVAAGGAAFAVAVSYSFLALGWHYPTDVIGGFLVAGTWTLLGIAAVYLVGGRSAERQAETRAVSLRDVLAAPAIAFGAVLLLAAFVALARPHQVVDYARQHHVFVIGSIVIALLALVLSTGLTLALRR